MGRSCNGVSPLAYAHDMSVIDPVRSRYSAEEIAAFVHRLWARSGEPSEILSDVFVVLPRSGRVECVFDAIDAMGSARDTLEQLVESGIEVNALVPVHLLGQAHEQARGVGIWLQGWLEGEDGTPRFTAPERA